VRFYSQHGEDALLAAMFADAPAGCFVEVGCIDGRRFSNTLALEEAGWSGICIEAHSAYIESIRRNRPGSAVVHAAVGERDLDEVDFFACDRGTFSTLDESLEDEFRERFGEFFTGFELQRPPLRRISTILADAAAPAVDVLSIDVEGAELRALGGLDLERHSPRVIIIEALHAEDVSAIDALLCPAGYERCFSLASNQFYTLDPSLIEPLRGRRIACTLRHTAHPLDGGPDLDVRRMVSIPAAAPTPHAGSR